MTQDINNFVIKVFSKDNIDSEVKKISKDNLISFFSTLKKDIMDKQEELLDVYSVYINNFDRFDLEFNINNKESTGKEKSHF